MARFPKLRLFVDTGKVEGTLFVISQGIHGPDQDATVYLDFNGPHNEWDAPALSGDCRLTIKRGSGDRIEVTGTVHMHRGLDGQWFTTDRYRNPFFLRRGRINDQPGKRDADYLWAALRKLCANLPESFLIEGERARLTDEIERAESKEADALAEWEKVKTARQTCQFALADFNGKHPAATWEDCGSCGAQHPVGYTGDCRNDAMRRTKPTETIGVD